MNQLADFSIATVTDPKGFRWAVRDDTAGKIVFHSPLIITGRHWSDVANILDQVESDLRFHVRALASGLFSPCEAGEAHRSEIEAGEFIKANATVAWAASVFEDESWAVFHRAAHA